MSQYLSKKKVLLSFCLFNLFTSSINAQQQVFKCSPQTLDDLCNSQKLNTVCAVDDDNQYLTFNSACEACGHDDTVSYTEGPCKCPQLPCNQNQSCMDGRCLSTDTLTTKQLVQIARSYLSKQKNKDALVYLEKIISQRPQDHYPLYLAALASFGDQKYSDSLKYIKRALLLDSNIGEFYIIRGRAFSSLKQYQEAEKQFQKALSLGFDDIGLVSFYQAQNLLSSKRNQQAIIKFGQAIKYHPQKAQWYIRKAMAHAINKQDKMAILTCKQGLKVHPNNEQIRVFMDQFKIIDTDKQQDLEDMQAQNQKAGDGNNTKGPDPQMINKFIKQKQQEQRIEFDRQRLEQKKKKQLEQQLKKAQKLSTQTLEKDL